MKRLGIFLAIATAFIGGPVLAQQRHIPKVQLEDMFANIKTQTPWNTEGNMLWGYFFTGTDQAELKKVATELAGDGYRLVEIRKRESDAPQAMQEWQLHVERIETHSVDSLNTRNSALEGLASHFNAVIYDGMDVGPVEESK
jgi:hypothetical protein